MTSAEAEQFIQQREGRLCVTFFRRTDGTILTRDCPTGAALRRRRTRWLFASAAAVWGLVAYAFTACGFDRFSETPLANAWPFKTLVDAVQNRLVATTTPPQIGGRSDGGLFP